MGVVTRARSCGLHVKIALWAPLACLNLKMAAVSFSTVRVVVIAAPISIQRLSRAKIAALGFQIARIAPKTEADATNVIRNIWAN